MEASNSQIGHGRDTNSGFLLNYTGSLTGTDRDRYSEPTGMKKTLVAIFEDDLVNRYIYEKMLRTREDIVLHIFDHAEKGIEAFKNISFDVVFIEAHFRENFGGISILNKVRPVSQQGTVFIAISSLLQKGDLEKLMAAGFVMCLEKPIAFAEVFTKS